MRPGEALYFPWGWWHSTLNIDTAVYITTFLSSTTTQQLGQDNIKGRV